MDKRLEFIFLMSLKLFGLDTLKKILGSIRFELENRNGMTSSYGQLPSKIIAYEELYDPPTGGWLKSSKDENNGPLKMDYGSVELEVGRFWYAFIRMTKPKSILETGAYKGYSTCCIASALKDNNENGHIITIDPLPMEHLWEGSPLAPFITKIETYSQEVLPLLGNKSFDLLVLDSDHSYKTIMSELISFEKLLKINGFILMHDSLFFDGVGAAVKQLCENPRFEVITIDSPRKHEYPNARCPGVTIVKKLAEGNPELFYEKEFDSWYIGDHQSMPYLYNKWQTGNNVHQ